MDNLRQSPRGEVITFYSYKGGTGRSMLLANVAWQLASSGSRVLVIDWDLEAPGIHRYFKPFLGDDPELRHQDGVMEWVTSYWDAFLDAHLEGRDIDVTELVSQWSDPRHFVRRLETGNLVPGGIDLMGAGRQDKSYGESVSDFDWTKLYRQLKGEEFIAISKGILVGSGGYDYVLIDSRTGVSDTSGFCTVEMADTLVVCFTYNNQSVNGASQIARDIKRQAVSRREVAVREGRSRPFRLFAVPSRVDDLDPERLERRQRYAWDKFADLLKDNIPPDQQTAYWLSVQVRNQGLFAYEEVLAACVNRSGDQQTVLGSVANLTRWLTDHASSGGVALGDAARDRLRKQFAGQQTSSVGYRDLSAWDEFTRRYPEPGQRLAILQGSLPLLSQLVAPSGEAGKGSELVLNMVLESDLTIPERRMAESLISAGVVQRRITEDRQRGIMIADSSILDRWDDFRSRLDSASEFIGIRELIRQARRGWEVSGRSLVNLQQLQAEFSEYQLSNEQRTWMGLPNLRMLQLCNEWRGYEMSNKKQREQLEEKIADSSDNALRLDERARTLEKKLDDQSSLTQDQASKAALAKSRLLMYFGVAMGIAVAISTGLAWYAGKASSEVEALKTERDHLNQSSNDLRRQVTEIKVAQQAREAQALIAKGIGQAQSAGGSVEKWNEAINTYTRAIELDPGAAEAYRWRARARQAIRNSDFKLRLVDWVKYYSLAPDIVGRFDNVVLPALEVYDKFRSPDVESILIEQLAICRSELNGAIDGLDMRMLNKISTLENIRSHLPQSRLADEVRDMVILLKSKTEGAVKSSSAPASAGS